MLKAPEYDLQAGTFLYYAAENKDNLLSKLPNWPN